jgi:hypothetical protein
LPPGEQKYCGLRACQLLRREDWEREKLRTDPDYREKRNRDKADWRKAHAREDAAYRRRRRAAQRAALDVPGPPDPGPVASGSAVPVDLGRGSGIPLGRYVMQPVDVVGAPRQVVEVAVLSVYPSGSTEQIGSASETDAFGHRRSVTEAAGADRP